MSAQHTQEPVAKVCWQYDGREFGGSIPIGKSIFPIGPISGLEVGTLLYAFPPDAAARIAELEAYGRTRADEMLAATVRIAELEKQRDTLLSALEELNSVSARGFLYDDPARVKARAAITSVKEQA